MILFFAPLFAITLFCPQNAIQTTILSIFKNIFFEGGYTRWGWGMDITPYQQLSYQSLKKNGGAFDSLTAEIRRFQVELRDADLHGRVNYLLLYRKLFD